MAVLERKTEVISIEAICGATFYLVSLGVRHDLLEESFLNFSRMTERFS